MRSDAVNIEKLKNQVYIIRALPLLSEYPRVNLQFHPKTRGITQTGGFNANAKSCGITHTFPLLCLSGNKSPFHESPLQLRAISPDRPEIQPAEEQCAPAINASPGAFKKSNKIPQTEPETIGVDGHKPTRASLRCRI